MDIFDIKWHNYKETEAHTIGYLIYNGMWYFRYDDNVINAINSGFKPFPDMPDITKMYRSKNLFPVFLVRYKNSKMMKKTDGSVVTDKIRINYMRNKK